MIRSVALLVVLLLTIAGCGPQAGPGSTTTTTTPAAGQFSGTVNVGVSTSLSGSGASFGQVELKGLQLAIEDINQAGGLLGKRVNLIATDDAGDASTGVTNTRNLILNEKSVAIFGPNTSVAAAAMQGLATQYKIPLIQAGAGDVALSTTAFSPYAFTSLANSYMGTKAIGAFLAKQKYKRYATIAPDYSWGHNTVDGFKSSMKDFGADYQIVSQQWPSLQATDFSSYISATLAAKPDFVFMPLFGNNLLTFLKQAPGYKFFDQTPALTFWDEAAFAALKDATPPGVLVWASSPPLGNPLTPEMEKMLSAYKSKFGESPTTQAALGYVAAQVWAAAVKKANTFDGEPVVKAIEGTPIDTVVGKLTYRACDHQADAAVYMGAISGQLSPHGYPILKDLKVIPASDTMMTCDAAKALQPKR
jgi:branched-chain amino acid transport system substrate-binding protein